MSHVKYLKTHYILILSSIFFLTSCGSTYIFYRTDDNHIHSALTDKEDPPTKAVPTNININIGSWRLDAMSVSPDGEYLALAMLSSSVDKGKIEIYNQKGSRLKRSFSNSDLKNMIESATGVTYPGTVGAFIPYKLGYENDIILIAYIQPQNAGDSTPQDVELRINLKTKQVVGTPVFFERTNRPPLPTHPSKNKFNFEVINGEMFVNGNKLNGLPGNIDENLHDEVTL